MIDKTSDTWEEIEQYIDTEIAAASRKLESVQTKESMTMYYRGVHAALIAIKALPEKIPEIVLQPSDYS